LRPAARTIACRAIVIVSSITVHFAALAGHVTQATGNARIDTLLSRMTLAEKLTLIHDGPEDPATYQGQAGYIGGVPRLGIPGLRLADGPPGILTRHASQAETATMGVAASFDVALAEQNGVVIGREARALGIDVALQPYADQPDGCGRNPGHSIAACHGRGQAFYRLRYRSHECVDR
jgi:beta-glucosidase